jgi:hypothetical protein
MEWFLTNYNSLTGNSNLKERKTEKNSIFWQETTRERPASITSLNQFILMRDNFLQKKDEKLISFFPRPVPFWLNENRQQQGTC